MDQPVYEREGEPTTAVNVAVLAALMALLGLTIGMAFLIPGGKLGLAVAMGIAAVKALLVVAYFMHVRYGNKLTMVFASAGFVWLGILFVITMLEVTTR